MFPPFPPHAVVHSPYSTKLTCRLLFVFGVRVFTFQAGKLASEVTRAHVVELMQPLLAAVKDPNMKVKLVGERAMIYVLELHSRNETLNEYIARADGESARFVRDYARRVLMRLNPESDTEEEKDTA